LKAGDIITKVDGTAVNQSDSLVSIIDQDQVGQTVNLTVVRGSQTINVNVTLAAEPTS
jgi:putative serine protease PepD